MNHQLIQQYAAWGVSPENIERAKKLAGDDEQQLAMLLHRLLFEPHLPIAYLTGKCSFMGKTYDIDRRSYVPNTETQQMLQLLMDRMHDNATIIDMGTGSGVVAITIALEKPTAHVIAVDLDPGALSLAQENAALHGVTSRIKFFQSLYCDFLPDELNPNFVICDFPYGDLRRPDTILLTSNLKEFAHEPQCALFDPRGALASYAELIESIQRKNWRPVLFIETGRVSKDEVEQIVPLGDNWEFVKMTDYSVTIIWL